MRHASLALLLVLPALLVLAPPVPAAIPAGAEIELLTPPVGGGQPYAVFYRDLVWNPEGSLALIIGGIRGPVQNPCAGWSFVMSYDGANFEVLRNQTGCILFKGSWAPDGSHALIVGERDTILKYEVATKSFKNVWALSALGLAGNHFVPRSVAYRPNGEYALITGNDLLMFYPTKDGATDVLLPGSSRAGDFYDAIAWSPDSRYAIMEAGVTDADGTRALGMVAFYAHDATLCAKNGAQSSPCIYYRGLYGKYDPGFTDIDGITFGLAGRVAWIYGFDGGFGTMLRYLEAEDQFDVFTPYEHKSGRITSMAWQPNAYRVLYTGHGDGKLFMSESWKYSQILQLKDCGSLWPTKFPSGECPNFQEVAWHPSGESALVIGGGPGWIWRYKPRLTPSVQFDAPLDDRDLTGDSFLVRGRANAAQLTRFVDAVQVKLDEGPWVDAEIGIRVTGGWPWNTTISLAGLVPGSSHFLEARASDDGGATWGPPASVRFYISDPSRQHATLVLASENGAEVRNRFNLTWNELAGANYLLQRSGEPTFVAPENLYSTAPRMEFPLHKPGVWFFRVAARGGLSQGEWSNVVQVTVTTGPDRNAAGDGGTPSIDFNEDDEDIEEPAGRDPTPTGNTPANPTGTAGRSTIPSAPLALAALAAVAGALAVGRRRR